MQKNRLGNFPTRFIIEPKKFPKIGEFQCLLEIKQAQVHLIKDE